jgi:ligand-binding sensor domain-containing protein
MPRVLSSAERREGRGAVCVRRARHSRLRNVPALLGAGATAFFLAVSAAAASPLQSALLPRVLRVLPEGERLWLGTTTGVWELDEAGRVVQVWTEAQGLPSAVVYDLARAPDGTLWVATSGGPARKRGARFEAMLEGLPAIVATTVLPLRSGAVYLGTSRGIARLQDDRWEPVHETHEFGRDRVLAAAEAADGAVWFAKEREITVIDPGQGMRVIYHDPLNPDAAVQLQSTRAHAVSFDVLGRLWLATDQGLTVLEGDRVLSHERWRPGPWGVGGLPASRIWAIWIDADDTIWLTFGDGPDTGVVARRRRAAGTWEKVRLESPAPAVYSLSRDAGKRLWAGTSEGLFVFENDRFVPWPLTATAATH